MPTINASQMTLTSMVGRDTPLVNKSDYILFGVISAGLSLILLPVIFGPCTIFCGYKIDSRWGDFSGAALMVFGSLAMIIGMVIGAGTAG